MSQLSWIKFSKV